MTSIIETISYRVRLKIISGTAVTRGRGGAACTSGTWIVLWSALDQEQTDDADLKVVGEPDHVTWIDHSQN